MPTARMYGRPASGNRVLIYLATGPRSPASGAGAGALPDGQIGPIPGAYALLAGRLPVPESTAADLRASAESALSGLRTVPDYLRGGLLEHGAGKLQRQVRLLCTDVWPVLYQALTLRTGDPLAVWRLSKPAAIALFSASDPLGSAIRAFDTAARAYYPEQSSVELALAVLRTGLSFRRAVAAEWARASERVPDETA